MARWTWQSISACRRSCVAHGLSSARRVLRALPSWLLPKRSSRRFAIQYAEGMCELPGNSCLRGRSAQQWLRQASAICKSHGGIKSSRCDDWPSCCGASSAVLLSMQLQAENNLNCQQMKIAKNHLAIINPGNKKTPRAFRDEYERLVKESVALKATAEGSQEVRHLVEALMCALATAMQYEALRSLLPCELSAGHIHVAALTGCRLQQRFG